VAKGNLGDILATIRSIPQEFDAEIVVAEGSDIETSEDIGKEVLKAFPKVIYLRGPDHGIYDGMSRAVSATTGEFIWFLNSGDRVLFSEKVRYLLEALPFFEADLIIGLQLPDLRFATKLQPFTKFLFLSGFRPIPHQSTIFRRDLFRYQEVFNTEYEIEADQDLFFRLLMNEVKIKLFNMAISIRDPNGIGDGQKGGDFANQISTFSKKYDYANNVIFRILRRLTHLYFRIRKSI
jgi:glycosyltransferase involved in cell wall biosynthesis